MVSLCVCIVLDFIRVFFFFQAEDGIRDRNVTGVQTCALPISQQTQADQAKAEQDRKQGLHCLSGWDGSNRSLVDQVKRQLREPDSFEHIETDIQPEVNGKHSITMEYRARNGFGGMNVATAEGVVDHETCEDTLIITSDQLLAVGLFIVLSMIG